MNETCILHSTFNYGVLEMHRTNFNHYTFSASDCMDQTKKMGDQDFAESFYTGIQWNEYLKKLCNLHPSLKVDSRHFPISPQYLVDSLFCNITLCQKFACTN